MTQTNSLKITQEKINTFRYLITDFNSEGWADASKFHPIPFDLVLVETLKGKKFPAWWNQHKWEGLRLKSSDSIKRWKRRRYEHLN